jgi:Tfp pilus assembly protein PilO
MKRLSPDKRNKLVLVIVATLAVIGLIYFFLITPQKELNRKLANEAATELTKLQLIKTSIKQAGDTAAKVGEITQQLSRAEEDTATGDLYAWTYDTIRRFKAAYHVDIANPSQPTPGECDLIGNLPYKQIKFQITGTGYYHDIGKFVADLENKFPHLRVVNLTVDAGGAAEGTSEKLSFRMEIAALIKPNA